MERQLNDLLKLALTPMDEPDARLNQNILKRVKSILFVVQRDPITLTRRYLIFSKSMVSAL